MRTFMKLCICGCAIGLTILITTSFGMRPDPAVSTDTQEIVMSEDTIFNGIGIVNGISPSLDSLTKDCIDKVYEDINDPDGYADQETQDPEYIEYIIKIEDKNFTRISEKVYGDSQYAQKLLDDNGLANSRWLAGDKIRVYPTDTIDVHTIQENIDNSSNGKAQDGATPSPDVGNNLAVEAMTVEEAVAYIKNNSNPADVDTSNFTYIGEFRVTGYDPHCKHCCSKTTGITGSGRPAEFGISCGSSYDLKNGTLVYAEGYGFYRVDDKGVYREGDHMIDIACPSHEVCRFMTNKHVNMYIVEYPEE